MCVSCAASILFNFEEHHVVSVERTATDPVVLVEPITAKAACLRVLFTLTREQVPLWVRLTTGLMAMIVAAAAGELQGHSFRVRCTDSLEEANLVDSVGMKDGAVQPLYHGGFKFIRSVRKFGFFITALTVLMVIVVIFARLFTSIFCD